MLESLRRPSSERWEAVARICDRSPCDTFLKALGVWIFGIKEGQVGFYVETPEGDETHIDYCPFCGTRLEEIESVILEKFTRPRRRRRLKTPEA